MFCVLCKNEIGEDSNFSKCNICLAPAHVNCILKSETSLTGRLDYFCQHCENIRFILRHSLDVWLIRNDKRLKLKLSDSATESNETAVLLLKLGANPLALDHSLKLPLHYAIKSNNIEVMNTLMLFYRDTIFNLKYFQSRGLLHYAALHGSLEAVKLLVKSGADKNAVDCIGQTPMFMAAMRGHIPIMDFLRSGTTDLNAKCFDGRTVLHRAVWHGNAEAIRWLLAQGVNPNCGNRANWTPLHSAAASGNITIAKLLLEHGALVNATTRSNEIPLQIAQLNGCNLMYQFLLQESNR